MSDIAKRFKKSLVARKILNDSQLSAVVEVFGEIMTAGKQLQAVRYIGPRTVYGDAKFRTGSWSQGEVKLVPGDIARKMISMYPDVYRPAESTSDAEIVEIVDKKEKDGLDEKEQSLLEFTNILQAMNDPEQIRQFARERLMGFEIDGRVKDPVKLRELVETQARISLPV
jgi:hypothetical protein